MSDLASHKTPRLSQVSGAFGLLKWAAAAIILVYLGTDSYFIVQPT